MKKEKTIIYQLFPRLFGNTVPFSKKWGMPVDNGCGKFQDINNKAINSLKELHVSHIWLTGIIRHASASSFPNQNILSSNPQILKGLAGSPYAIKDYYDVNPDLAISIEDRMEEFDDLVNRIHENGMKVIIDFVPNHVSRDYKSEKKPVSIKDLGEDDDTSYRFLASNNFYYIPGEDLDLPDNYGNKSFHETPAKATGNNVFSSRPSKNDWYETVKLNYGLDPQYGIKQFDPIPDTWKKMTEILRYWCKKGVDGFRCDMAGMVPVEFWHYAIGNIKEDFKEVKFIAEIYEPDAYKEYIETAGFDYLYDKCGLYDTLRDVMSGTKNTSAISDIWKNLEGLDNHLLRFMENHDEQRIASYHFAGDGLKGLPATALSAMMNSGPVMIYNGQEVGECAKGSTGFSGDDGRTSIFDYCSMPELQKWVNGGLFDGGLLSSTQKSLRQYYCDILEYTKTEAVFTGQFYDLMWQNQDLHPDVQNRVFAFLRYNDDSVILVVACFGQNNTNIRIRIPEHALGLTHLAGNNRFTIKYIYPDFGETNLMTGQITGSGIPINFNPAGWSAIRID